LHVSFYTQDIIFIEQTGWQGSTLATLLSSCPCSRRRESAKQTGAMNSQLRAIVEIDGEHSCTSAQKHRSLSSAHCYTNCPKVCQNKEKSKKKNLLIELNPLSLWMLLTWMQIWTSLNNHKKNRAETSWLIARKLTANLNLLLENASGNKGVLPPNPYLSVGWPSKWQAFGLAGFAVQVDQFGSELVEESFAFEVPDLDGRTACGAQPVAVGRESQGVDFVFTVRQSVQVLSCEAFRFGYYSAVHIALSAVAMLPRTPRSGGPRPFAGSPQCILY